MSFAFGFGGDDIEDDGENDDLVRQIDECDIGEIPLKPPKKHSLQELLNTLPSQLSYNTLSLSQGLTFNGTPLVGRGGPDLSIVVPRRSLFDIRAQLMAEANPYEKDVDGLLSGLENGDLTAGVYEGGFKTWECSLDLASVVADLPVDRDLHIIELGAGSSIPSLVLLQKALQRRQESPSCRISFTLCDYNEDVLRLAAASNVFLVAELSRQREAVCVANEDMDIDDIDEEKVGAVIEYLRSRGVTIEFVSGAWGDDFVRQISLVSRNPVGAPQSTLILASETIYSPKAIRVFADTVMQLLRHNPDHSTAMVAAKKMYFGVGGGVIDLNHEMAKRGSVLTPIMDVDGAGVGRVVLKFSAQAEYGLTT